jgi:hypothetical protein
MTSGMRPLKILVAPLVFGLPVEISQIQRALVGDGYRCNGPVPPSIVAANSKASN